MLIRSYEERQSRMNVKKIIILKYLRNEIWSNSLNLAQIIGVTKTAIYKTLNKLENQLLIRSHYIPELKFNIWGITQKGILYSWDENEFMEDRYCFEPSKIKAVMIQHHLDLQQARYQAEAVGWKKWLPGNQLPKGIAKRPDAIAEDASEHQVIAIELERSIKTKKRYEVIFSTYLQSIKRGEYASIHYVCPDPEFATRLKRMFQLIESVPVSGQRVKISDKHRAKFPVYSLQNWPPHSEE